MTNKVNIIAEIGINHQGDLNLMKKMMIEAKKCGVDYVKSQKRDPKTCLSELEYNKPYESPHSFGSTYGEHKENLEFSLEEWAELFAFAGQNSIKMFTSVFDVISANNINNLGVEIFKIGSAEVTNIAVLEHVCSFGKPVILSTGMSTIEEIDVAVDVLKKTDLILMHCTSAYPCEEKDVNLNIITTLKDRYKLPVGLSGHYNQGSGAIESAAVALGAEWIERHFTLDRTMKGTDQSSSLEPTGMKRVVKSIRSVERSMGCKNKVVFECEYKSRKKFRNN
jgi:sialic acid synthase